MKRDPKLYFLRPINYIDLFQYLGTVWIVVTNLINYRGMSMTDTRNLCMSVLICQGIKALVDWLRLFDKTTFFVTLIGQTFSDIGYFLLIILVLLIYIGNAMYMLQLNAVGGEENVIVQPIF